MTSRSERDKRARHESRTATARPLLPGSPRLSRTRGFLYHHVAQELKHRLRDRIYPPGTRIPTEAELVREFKVSAITVRRALRDLTAEGLLFGRQGLGVFVTDTRRIIRQFGRGMRLSLADEVRRAGFQPSLRVRSLVLTPGEPETARRLGLSPGSLLYRYEAVLLADGEPVGLDTAYFSRKLGGLIREELSHTFIFSALRARGIPMDHVDYQFQGSTVSDDEAPILGLPVGFPLLAVHFTLIRPDGAAIVTGRTVSRADRFTYAFCGRPGTHSSPERRRERNRPIHHEEVSHDKAHPRARD